jgi:AraC family transcriptional regulator of arabinose operon
MSYTTDRYRLHKHAGQSLAITECGIQICHPGHATPHITYPDYSAHFILEGKGTYSVNGKTYELEAGQGFMITPDIPNIYVADEKEPWRYIYATFKGIDAKTLVYNAGLDDENVIFSFPLTDEVIDNLKNMHAAGKDYLSKGYDILGHFLQFTENRT